jgi:hypothetical protein
MKGNSALLETRRCAFLLVYLPEFNDSSVVLKQSLQLLVPLRIDYVARISYKSGL